MGALSLAKECVIGLSGDLCWDVFLLRALDLLEPAFDLRLALH